MRCAVMLDLGREMARRDRESALDNFAESYGPCPECGAEEWLADQAGEFITLVCQKCDHKEKAYIGRDYE